MGLVKLFNTLYCCCDLLSDEDTQTRLRASLGLTELVHILCWFQINQCLLQPKKQERWKEHCGELFPELCVLLHTESKRTSLAWKHLQGEPLSSLLIILVTNAGSPVIPKCFLKEAIFVRCFLKVVTSFCLTISLLH